MTASAPDGAATPSPPPEIGRSPLLSRGLVAFFGADVGATVSFYLLLSVVPMYATSGTGSAGTGLTTGVLMFGTLIAELGAPRLTTRFGFRRMFGVSLLLLGGPTLALLATDRTLIVVAVCLLRGLGFGLGVVIGGALVASLVPDERRGEGLGLYGVVSGVPAVVGLPLGVWLAEQGGYRPVFVAGAASALAGFALLAGVPRRTPMTREVGGMALALRNPALMRPALVFAATTVATGVVITFLPVVVTNATMGRAGGAVSLAAVALFVQTMAATVGRWWAGRFGDRHGSAVLVMPAVLATGLGVLGLVMSSHAVILITGMALFGAGFGVTQNVTLALMFDRVADDGYATVSALWSVAYDAGLGLGAAGFGVVAVATGFPLGFACVSVLTLVALVPAWRDLRKGPTNSGVRASGNLPPSQH